MDVEALELALRDGATLPADWYFEPSIARLEEERIFHRSWQYAGRVAQVARRGDFLTCRTGRIPVVVVRDRAGDLKAHVNVCRHRGSEIVSGEGRRETLQCPYHAWTYDLDGSLRAAPRSEREPGFDRSRFSLPSVAADTWGPFVFVNPDPEAPPLGELLGELPGIVAASGLDLDGLVFRERLQSEVRANWKVVVENFLECYHCPTAHPGFSELIDVDPAAYRLEEGEWFSSQIGRVRGSALEEPKEGLYDARGELAAGMFHFLWPNFTLNSMPGPPNAVAGWFLPLDEERTLSLADVFYAAGADEEYLREVRAFRQQVAQEDNALVESVQRGLRSGTLARGRLMLGSEHLIHHFYRLVHRALTAN